LATIDLIPNVAASVKQRHLNRAESGGKPVVLSGGVGLALILPLLSIVSSPIALGAALFVFGAFLRSLDVAMNLHAVDV
jgi:hypothetical protein